MAKKKPEPLIELLEEHISDDSLDNIMGDRYAIYAKYVIQDRAIPDVRDGLKPVQRRIIYSMYQSGNTFDKPTRKCAKIVGDVMGRFHPHGDSSIYEALVRLSQTWKMSMPLVTFQGNNGSIDNDPAAAYRYTEAKLNQFSEELVDDIDKNTVDMILNFDDTELEPVVLPCRFPNLFVNGSDGIAVAIATQIPPHNLNEMCEAAIYRIQHHNCSLDELLEIVKAPDFPTGGVIYKSNGIREMYETGRGKIDLCSKVTKNTSDKSFNQLIITEIPYGVVKQQLVYSIDKLRKDGTVDGIYDVKDLSSGDEIRIVIEIKKEANIDVILQYLMQHTNLNVSYSANIVAICDRHPRTLGLIAYLDQYIAYQIEVVTRKTKFILDKSVKRLEIVEGLIKAISIINEIVKIIRGSKDKADAKNNLMKAYGFSEPQVEAIVTMPLYRLTNTDVVIYENEKKDLDALIADLRETLDSPTKLKKIIIKDLNNIINTYNTPRRTEIIEEKKVIQIDKRDLIAKEDVYVQLTEDGYAKRISERAYAANYGTEPGVKEGDRIVMSAKCSTVDFILCITNRGNYMLLPVHDIQEGKWKDEGKHINYTCNLPHEEKIVSCFIISDFSKDVTICTATKHGNVKKSPLKEIPEQKTSRPVSFSRVAKDDEIIGACILHNNTNILVITEKGNTAFFSENDISMTHIKTAGVKAISTQKAGDLVSLIPVEENEKGKLILVTDKGFYKIVDLGSITLRERMQRSTPLLKIFKTDVHNLVYVEKIPHNQSETIYRGAVLNDNSKLVLKIDDFHLAGQDKYCKTNIDEMPSNTLITKFHNANVEYVDEKTKVDERKVFFQEELLAEKPEDDNEEEFKLLPDEEIVEQESKEPPVVEEDDTPFVPQVKVKKEKKTKRRIEQISIWDDMGD